MNQPRRPLSGLAIGISISESETLLQQGLTHDDVNLVTIELSRRLIALGAGVNLGHQWRPGGIMEAIARFARTYQEDVGGPIIHNFLAWPNRAGLSFDDRQQLSRLVTIHEGREMRPEENENDSAAALTTMRRRLVNANQGSIALSGRLRATKLSSAPNFVPGLIEEIALMVAPPRPKPVYLSRIMGGVASGVIDFLESGRAPVDFRAPQSERLMYYLHQLEAVDARKFADICGLTHPELRELFDAHNLDTIIGLTSLGMQRLLRDGRVA